MIYLCNDIELIKGKIFCKHTGTPCAHVRYCAVSNKYYQTDNAKICKVRDKNEKTS